MSRNAPEAFSRNLLGSRSRLQSRYRLMFTALALLPVIAIAGCSAAPAASAPNHDEPSAADSATSGSDMGDSGSDSSLVIDNCGTSVTFTQAPSRVVSIKSTSTEMLLALGLANRVTGTAFSDGPIPSAWAAEPTPSVLSDSVPSQEAVLAQQPDLVYAGWESNFSADSAGTRDSYQHLGVNTFVSPAACKGVEYRPSPLTFDDLFADITQVGEIFQATDAATELVAEQRAELAHVTPDDSGVTALWYSSGSDTPYVGAGIGAPQMIMTAAGLTNIAADIEDSWSPLGWETVIERNPDVIVLIDSSWGSTEKKIGVLEANPATAKLDAVEQGRYLVLPFASSEAGVRSVSAVSSLVSQLEALGIAG